MTSPFRLLGTVTLGSGVINALERDHLIADDGRGLRRDRLTHPGAVAVVAVGSTGVWMIRQYRPAVRDWVWEVPAGLREPGEAADATAFRECVEEVGWAPGRLDELGRLLSSPGILAEHIDVFLATDLEAVPRRPSDTEEALAEVVEVPPAVLVAMIESGEIVNGITIAALALAGWAPGPAAPIGRLPTDATPGVSESPKEEQ